MNATHRRFRESGNPAAFRGLCTGLRQSADFALSTGATTPCCIREAPDDTPNIRLLDA